MLHVIVSRYGSRNTEYIYNQIKEGKKKNRKSYLIVPDQFTLGTEVEMFDRLNLTSTIDIKVKSFKTIVNEVLNLHGDKKRNYLSDEGERILMNLVLRDIRDELELYDSNIYDDGFVKLLITILSEFKSNNVNYQSLSQAGEGINDGNFRKKINDLTRIYSQYERILADKYFDKEDRAIEAVSKIKYMDEYRNIDFYIDQFHTMSQLEIRIVEELVKIGAKVYITSLLDPRMVKYLSSNSIPEYEVSDSEVFEISRRLLNNLSNNLKLNIISLDSNLNNPDIDYLLKNIFSYKKPLRYAGKSIHINRFNNTSEEISMLCSQINKDVIDHGYRYKDIAVIVTNKDEYYKLIKREFSLNKIPFFLDETRNISENPMVKLLHSSLNLFSSYFTSESIITFAKYSFIDFSDYEINQFENFISQRKIRAGMLFNDKYFKLDDNYEKNNKYHYEDSASIEVINKIRSSIIELIENFYRMENEKISFKEDKISNHARDFYYFISSPQIIDNISKYEDNLPPGIQDVIKEENRQIWNNFIKILDEIVELVGDRIVPFDNFARLLLEGINNLQVGILPPSQDQIIVGDISRSRINRVKKIYIVGLTNIYYPHISKNTEIFIEEEKEYLINQGIKIQNTIEQNSLNEDLSLYNNISKASEEISFSYSLINSDNESMDEAFILSYISQCTADKNIKLNPINREDILYSTSKLNEYLAEGIHSIRYLNNLPKNEEEYILNLYKSLNSNSSYSKKMTIFQKGLDYKPRRKNLSQELSRNLYKNYEKISISQIEEYQRCPYKHFISYGIKPRKSKNYDIDNLEIGNLIHSSVSKYTKRKLSVDNDGRVNKENIEKIKIEDIVIENNNIFEETRQEIIENYKVENPKNQFFLSLTKDSLDLSCYQITEQVNMSTPDRILDEEKFADRKEYPNLILSEEEGLSIEGIIDRIDEFHMEDKSGTRFKMVRIIDYKTGNKDFDISKVYNGLDIQLVIYLYAIQDHIEKENIKSGNTIPIGAFYLPLNANFLLDSDSNKEKLAESLANEFKLRGIIIENDKIEMHEEEEIYELKGRKRDFYSKDNVVSLDFTKKLFYHISEIIIDSFKDIKLGKIDVKPYKMGSESPCTYCEYRSICKFEENNYRYINRYSWEEIKDKLNEGDTDE